MKIIDLTVDKWNKIYEHLFGGFETLADNADEDEEEEDELENVPSSMKTKDGYLKDGFIIEDVLEDADVVDGDADADENESSDDDSEDECDSEKDEETTSSDAEEEDDDESGNDSDDSSELNSEEYNYSDDE